MAIYLIPSHLYSKFEKLIQNYTEIQHSEHINYYSEQIYSSHR